MENELKNVIAESLPADVTPESLPADVNLDSSPDKTQHAEATAQKAVEKEVPFGEHPRWQEVQREKESAREEAARAKAEAAYWKGLAEGTKNALPKEDPYAGLNDEQRAFYKSLDERIDQRAEQKARHIIESVKGELETGKAVVTALMYERFQEKHPDVKSGSVEESAIAQRVSQGHSLEDAYQLVMQPKSVSALQQEITRLKQIVEGKQIKDKQAANLETNSSNLKQNVNLKGREKMAAFVDEYLKNTQT